MRKLLVILMFLLIGAGAAFAFLPGAKGDALRAELGLYFVSANAGGKHTPRDKDVIIRALQDRWAELEASMQKQIATELATVEKLKAGKIKLGAAGAPAPQNKHQAIEILEEKHKNSSPRKTDMAARRGNAPPPAQVSAPAPQDAFSAIVTKEDRGPPPPPDPFWTEERKQEAIKNGEPKSGGPRACLFLCGKKD